MSDCTNALTLTTAIATPLAIIILFVGWVPILAVASAIEKIANAKADAIRANARNKETKDDE